MNRVSLSRRSGAARRGLLVIVAASVLVGATACAGTPAAPAGPEEVELGISDADYTLDALIAAAKDEDPITVLDTTGKIVDIAENFTKKYGLQATGVKVTGIEQGEMAVRESQAKNVQSDVLFMVDAPYAVTRLIPEGIVTSWMPPDLKDVVPERFQDPVSVTQEPLVWAYNTEVDGDTCPVSNVWELTEDQWRGKVTMRDPLLTTEFPNWFNQMQDNGDDAMAQAYEDYFDEPLKTDEASATAEWVKRMAGNEVLTFAVGDDAAEAVGAAGQSEGLIGYVTAAKFRDNAESGYKLGLCKSMEPWVGHAYTKVAVIATGTDSPNLSKLFVHYMLTEEGIGPQVQDGKKSTNETIPLPADEPSGVESVWNKMLIFDTATADSDYDTVQDWQDFWTISSR